MTTWARSQFSVAEDRFCCFVTIWFVTLDFFDLYMYCYALPFMTVILMECDNSHIVGGGMSASFYVDADCICSLVWMCYLPYICIPMAWLLWVARSVRSLWYRLSVYEGSVVCWSLEVDVVSGWSGVSCLELRVPGVCQTMFCISIKVISELYVFIW